MAKIDLIVPDIGNFDDVDVIEIPIKVGDSVEIDQTLLTLESDKASMDLPAEHAGVITEILVKVGDTLKEGDLYARMDTAAVTASEADSVESVAEESEVKAAASGSVEELRVPDIGNFDEVDVIEVAIKPGDLVEVDQTLATLESDKASMDIPAEKAGTIVDVMIKEGDSLKEGDLVATIEVAGTVKSEASVASQTTESASEEVEKSVEAAPTLKAPHPAKPLPKAPVVEEVKIDFSGVHASPSVRAFARELGANLNEVSGTGRKGRILKEDVVKYIKSVLTGATKPAATGSGVGLDLLPWPKVDFSKFGEVEEVPLSRIKKISGANLARNWVKIPHVAQFDEADITELEALRKQLNKEYEREGARVTILAFLFKAVVKALQKFPEFNSSLEGENLILKKYYHIGFAADTPNGLVVPVIRDCDKKGVLEIAAEMRELAGLAREGKLTPDQMQGGTFTISSLGGIGGTNFIPIINAPEVAILGVARNQMKPVWNGKEFEPRLMLPLALSYDHRVIDGALGARFIVYLNQLLTDMRRALI